MTFTSLAFLFFFLPVTLLIYHLIPPKAKNFALLIISLLFFAASGIRFLLPFLGLILIQYCLARWIERQRGTLLGKTLVAVCVALDLGFMMLPKCSALVLEALRGLSLGQGLTVQSLQILGVSYFSFKLISYIADVYTGKVQAETNLIDFAAYVTAYPQLIVGPIVRYRDIAQQLKHPESRMQPGYFSEGAQMFVVGMSKKLLLADGLGKLWAEIGTNEGLGLANGSASFAWLCLIAYSLQLYFDFSGYSEMSNGLSLMLGFRCIDNFRLPYTADTMSDFWRRWHISLSNFFRDYIYIPLGGSRRGPRRQIAAMLAVWLTTGLWHGVTGNYLLWGLYHFALLLTEKYLLRDWLRQKKAECHIYVIAAAVLGWALFAADGTVITVAALLGKLCSLSWGTDALYALRNYGVLMAVGILCATPIPGRWWQRMNSRVKAPILLLLLLMCLAAIEGGSSSTALYAAF